MTFREEIPAGFPLSQQVFQEDVTPGPGKIMEVEGRGAGVFHILPAEAEGASQRATDGRVTVAVSET